MAFKKVIPSNVIAEPTLANPGDCCTETYLEIGPFADAKTRDRCFAYMKTRFFRFLLGIRKISQNMSRDTYAFIPLPNWDNEDFPWDKDASIFNLFGLDKGEVKYIEHYVSDVNGWTGEGLLNGR